MRGSVSAESASGPPFEGRPANWTPTKIKDITWRTNFERARQEAREARRPIVVKPLNQGGAGEYW